MYELTNGAYWDPHFEYREYLTKEFDDILMFVAYLKNIVCKCCTCDQLCGMMGKLSVTGETTQPAQTSPTVPLHLEHYKQLVLRVCSSQDDTVKRVESVLEQQPQEKKENLPAQPFEIEQYQNMVQTLAERCSKLEALMIMLLSMFKKATL